MGFPLLLAAVMVLSGDGEGACDGVSLPVTVVTLDPFVSGIGANIAGLEILDTHGMLGQERISTLVSNLVK